MAIILYVAGCRAFHANDLKPKFTGILDCWTAAGHQVDTVFGGDSKAAGVSIGQQAVSSSSRYKAAMNCPLLAPIKNSISEHRDIQNDLRVENIIEDIVAQNRPALIWERSSRLASAGLRVAKKHNIPYVLEWKDHIVHYRFSWHHHRAVQLEKQKNLQADFIVVESEKLRNDLTDEGVDRNKIYAAQNAVNPQQFQLKSELRDEYRKELGIKQTDVLVGYMGSFSHYHDILRLPLAADIVRKSGKDNIKFLIVGKGRDKEKLLKLLAKLNLLDSTVIFKEWVPVEDVPKVLSAIDIATLPGSTDIICPIKVQEYMVLGLSSVIPDYPANREVITDGKTGILFEPKNENSFAEKLMMLAENSDLRKTIGTNARKEALEKFTWEKTWAKVLQEIITRIESKDI